ncbi:MAG: type VII secretion protein EccCa, partial [Pseudonocardia sp.]|nr:type VII secretion protein EccCa [Pseudonocardia sp.]
MGTVEVVWSHRERPPSPEGELALQAPPEPEKVVIGGVLQRLLPLVMLVGSLGFVVVLGVHSPTSWLFGGMFAISTLAMMATGGGRGGAARASKIDESRRDYLRYLGQTRRTVREATGAQRAAAEAAHPDPEAWPAVLASGRLWERGAADADFGHVRIGWGAERLATRLVPPETGPPDGLEPVTALALRRFLVAHSVVPDLPVALSLRETATIWLEPEGEAARALARAIVAQFVLWHGPADARLALLVAQAALPAWDWAKWLPHNAHPRLRDGAGPLRMFTPEVDTLRRWWSAPPGVHLLVVVDGVADAMGPLAATPGVTVLRVGAPPGRRPVPSVVRLHVDVDRLKRVVEGVDGAVCVPDALPLAQAAAMARRLARYRLAGTAENPGTHAAPGLPGLLALRPGPAGIDALRARWRASAADRLRAPIGVDERGAAVVLDLKESAQGGSGPHGLCIGATGSGKSELLRTLVVGLAATHPPEALNFVLVDFKGGATFLGLAGMPHVSAVITNLADELTLVDRMADALAGEILRRQEILRAAGNLGSVTEYA